MERLGATGLGISLTPELDPPITVVDLDGQVDLTTRELTPFAQTIMERLNSYTEFSPSGTGLHCLVLGAKPTGACRAGALEMYSDQFMTVTGHRVHGSPADLQWRQNALVALHSEFLTKAKTKPALEFATRRANWGDDDDSTVLAKAFRSRRGQVIQDLWNGDTTAHNNDHSAADLALVNHLMYWTNRDRVQTDRLFRQSGLFREQWDKRHSADGRTYGQMTLDRAFGGGARRD